jgi:hypothetical protein
MSFINAQDFNEVNFAEVELLFTNLIKYKNTFRNEFIQDAIKHKIHNVNNIQTIYDTNNEWMNKRIYYNGSYIYITDNLNELYAFIVLVSLACKSCPDSSRASRGFYMLCRSLKAIKYINNHNRSSLFLFFHTDILFFYNLHINEYTTILSYINDNFNNIKDEALNIINTLINNIKEGKEITDEDTIIYFNNINNIIEQEEEEEETKDTCPICFNDVNKRDLNICINKHISSCKECNKHLAIHQGKAKAKFCNICRQYNNHF